MSFFKFPRTPHLFVPDGANIRDDKQLSEEEIRVFLQGTIIVEEKVDGANLGISFNHEGQLVFQNRNTQFTHSTPGQFEKLGEWVYQKYKELENILRQDFILFGEWCYAKHSIAYTQLPDWFIAFDIYDKQQQQFLSKPKRDAMLLSMGLTIIPAIAQKKFTKSALWQLLLQSKSAFAEVPVEGFYLRIDKGEYLQKRAKLVRPGFMQQIETHWSKQALVANTLA